MRWYGVANMLSLLAQRAQARLSGRQVFLVCLAFHSQSDQPNKPDRRDRPDEPAFVRCAQ